VREQIKQLLKNSVYGQSAETANGLGAVNGDERSLRVLMYQQGQRPAGKPDVMPVSLFDEQMAELRELGYVARRSRRRARALRRRRATAKAPF